MKRIIKILWAILITFLFQFCQEPYDIDDLDTDQKIPVIEGQIHNGPGPYGVNLLWAVEYNTDNFEPITDATVTIFDDNYHEEELTQIRSGFYITDENTLRGEIGREYVLRVRLGDGTVYESIPTVMEDTETIDSIYAEIGLKEVYDFNIYGELITTTKNGLYTFLDLVLDSENKRFYKFTSRLVSQSVFWATPPGGGIPINIYCWKISSLTDRVNVKSTIEVNSEQIIKKLSLGFINYEINKSTESDTSSASYPQGWVLSITAYSISEEACEYYNEINDQLDAEDRLFDPVPSQIIGNIRCLTDTNKIALGLFEVASRTTKHIGFDWQRGENEYRYLNIPEYTPPYSYEGCNDTMIPPFWIDFSILK